MVVGQRFSSVSRANVVRTAQRNSGQSPDLRPSVTSPEQRCEIEVVPAADRSPDSLAIGIVAHPKRYRQAEQLRKDVDAQYISYDFDNLGCEGNHLKVWARLAQFGTEWSVVMEDDAKPVNDFRAQLIQALSVAPHSVLVGCYLGTGYPMHMQATVKRALVYAGRHDKHWLVSRHTLNAVCIAMRTSVIGNMLDEVDLKNGPIDDVLRAWAKRAAPGGVWPIAYMVPSLVDHADTDTMVQHLPRVRKMKPRRAWQVGTRDVWNSNAFELKL